MPQSGEPASLSALLGSHAMERNLARIGPIIALNRVPANRTSWSKQLSAGPFGEIRASCTALGGHVVPHGIDNDVLFGLTRAFKLQGCPENDTVILNAAELLRLSSLTRSGRLYAQLSQSLSRMNSVTYLVSGTWRGPDEKIQSQINLTLIRRFSERSAQTPSDPDKPWQFTASSELIITLDPAIADSIRRGYISVLNPELYEQLSQPMTRTLYRLLNEYQKESGAPVFELQVSVLGQLLGFPEDKPPTKIQRDLAGTHQELTEKGYLSAVRFSGRGAGCTVEYHFASPAKLPASPSPLLPLLTERGIAEAAARALLTEYSKSEIVQACELFDQMVTGGYSVRSKGGLLTSILRSPHSYAQWKGAQQTQAAPQGRAAPAPAATWPEPEPELSEEDTRQRIRKNIEMAGKLKRLDQETVTLLHALVSGGQLGLEDSRRLLSVSAEECVTLARQLNIQEQHS